MMKYKNPTGNKRGLWLLLIVLLLVGGCGQKEATTPESDMQQSAELAGSIEPQIDVVEVTDTPVIPTATEAPTATEEPTPEPTMTLPPTIQPSSTPEPAPASTYITQWTAWGWTSSTSPMACQHTDSACWMLTDYKNISSLELPAPMVIDPGMSNPSLVFQTRYSIKESKTFGFVEIEVEGEVGWNRVYSLKGSRDYWHEVIIDLSEFSGKTINLRFSTKPYFTTTFIGEATKTVYNKETWIIQDVMIGSQ